MDETNPYEDAEPTPAPSSESESPEPETEKVDSGEQTALLPKAIFMGKDLKPGTKCEFEIVESMDSDVQVKYIPHKSKETSEEESAEAPGPDSEFDLMME